MDERTRFSAKLRMWLWRTHVLNLIRKFSPGLAAALEHFPIISSTAHDTAMS